MTFSLRRMLLVQKECHLPLLTNRKGQSKMPHCISFKSMLIFPFSYSSATNSVSLLKLESFSHSTEWWLTQLDLQNTPIIPLHLAICKQTIDVHLQEETLLV